MDKIMKFLAINISLIIFSFLIFILLLKFYLNINIISVGYFNFGFKYVSKQINPLIESIKIKNISFSYKRVKYSKGKVFIINIRGIRLKASPSFIDSISKAEESSFLKNLNKKIIYGIYKNTVKNEYHKSFNNVYHEENGSLNFPEIKINDDNNENVKNNIPYLNIKNSNYSMNKSDIYLNPYIDTLQSTGNISKINKKDLNMSSTTLYSSRPVNKIGVLKTLIYMLDNKYIFEIIIPMIISKLAINLIDIKFEVNFPEYSKIIYEQDYISFSSSRKELIGEKKNKYFDYIIFKNYDPYISKIRLLFSKFSLKFYEMDHSVTSLSPLSERINENVSLLLKENNNNLRKKFVSEQICNHISNSQESLRSYYSNDLFDNSNLNGFMNNELVQIFFFYLNNGRLNFNFQILNFQLISHSYVNNNIDMELSSIDFNNKYLFNRKPHFINVITVGEILIRGEALKSKSKLYNIITSVSLKNLYLDIIDYDSKYIIQFLNIKLITLKLESIIQFYKYKQHLSYMKTINFDFNIFTINLTSDFDYTYGLCQHINFLIQNINNKHKYKYNEDPFYNINKLLLVSREISLHDLSTSTESIRSSNYSFNINKVKNKSKNKNSLYDTIKLISVSTRKFSKLKVNINFQIKNIMLNYIILSEKIHDHYSIKNTNISLPNECILLQLRINTIHVEFCNAKKVKLQNILNSSTSSLNNYQKHNSVSNINLSISPTDDNDKYVIYEEQSGLHEAEFEINDINLTASFVNEESIIEQSLIRINETLSYEKNQGINLDKFTTKLVFSILTFDKDVVNTKKEDKLLIGTYFGNLKFNFGSSKLSSNTLIIIIDLIRNKFVSLFEQLTISNKFESELYSNETINSSNYDLKEGINNYSAYSLDVYYSTPELYFKNKRENSHLNNKNSLSSTSVNDYSADGLNGYHQKINNKHNEKKKINIFSHYMFIFDIKINTISFSILNPDDECGFQFDIKKILFHYNNNCYITPNIDAYKKYIIKPNNKVKNQFNFKIKEIDFFYLDTIKYLKKGIVMHHFLKINDIIVNLVDVNTKSLSNISEITSLSSLSNTESIQSFKKLKNYNESINLNKINFNIKKIRIYYSMDVFFSILSTANFIMQKIIQPFITSLKKSISENINITNLTNNNRYNSNNQFKNNMISASLSKMSSISSLSSIPAENIFNNIKLTIENIQLELDMPDNTKLFIYFKDNSISYFNTIKYDVNKILVLLPSQINKKSNLLKVKNLNVVYNINKTEDISDSDSDIKRNNTKDSLLDLVINSESAIVSIPYLFDLSDVIDSFVHMMKAMKNIVYTIIFGKVYVNTPTIIEPNEMIKAYIYFNMVSLQFVENEFESNLSKIYLYGTKEQKERVAREIAFEKKIADLRHIKNQGIKWINTVKKYKSEVSSTTSTLMGSISFYDLRILVDKPVLLGESSEETIHIIDERTPKDKIYDTLVPVNLTLKVGSATMDLRDYPEKMLYIPESSDIINRPSLIFTINVFITEQDPNEECKKWINVKYFHNRRSETILRTINPVKLFYKAKLVIQTNQKASFTWGYSNDPVFTHILQTVSAFSKDSYDPSEKLAWWDKMRLNFHGSLDVIITNGCDFDVHILGSCSPYYTLDSDYFGNNGINIIFGKGVNIKLGNTGVKNEVLRICCGELKCMIPRMKKEQYYECYYYENNNQNDIINNEVIVMMSGDVQLSIICTFNPIVDNYFKEPRDHNDLYLKLPQFATPYPNTTVFDSFSGFRTKNMNLNINLSSPSYYFAGLNYQHNYVHLSLDAINYIMNFSEFMSMGVLGLPIGVGPLYNKKVDKKFPMDISGLNIKFSVMPLMVGISSYINDECFPKEFIIGIRCKAQTLNMELSMINEDNKGLDFTYSNAIITSLEGKIYTLGNAISDEAKLYSFKGDDQSNIDSKDDDNDDIYSWRNDLDKFYLNNNIPINTEYFFKSSYVSYFKRNAIGDAEKLKKEYQIIENDISRVQVDLIQKRYFEIEILIRKLVEQQNNMDSYTNKFEQSVDIVDLLAILYEKKKILKEQMEKEENAFYFNNESLDTSNEIDTGLFNNIFIVHNIQLIWNQAVRNIIFKMVNLNNRINLLHNNMTYKLEKEIKKIVNKNSNRNNYDITNEKIINPLSEEQKHEQNTHFIVTEQDNNNTEDEDTIEFPEIQTKSDTYISSRNENSPDYVSPYEKTVNSMLINFINPEVCFEVGVDYIGKEKGLVLLVAKTAQYRSISITDLDVEDVNNVKDEEIIKRRSHVVIQDAQLNTANESKRNKFPLTLVLNTSDGKLGWPLWVPLECIFDPTSHCGIMEHIADSFNITWISDSYNASYVKPLERIQTNSKKSNHKSALENNKSTTETNGNNANLSKNEDNNNNNDNDNNDKNNCNNKNNSNTNKTLKLNTAYSDKDNEIDTNIIVIKECNLFATSLQYCTIYNVIFDLFSYTEPNVLRMEDNVQKLVFRIEQLDDMNAMMDNIYILKNNIRTLKRSIAQIGWKDAFNDELKNTSILDTQSKYQQLQNHLYQTQDDLLYIVLALKKINKIQNSSKKNSSKIKSKFIYMSKDLTYNMLLDNSVPYCECIFKDLKYQIETLDDKTNINSVELRKIVVNNLLEKDNIYMKALVPYLPHQREYMEKTKEKMFRLYYRENPAIGGIPIIDHFEINLIPILLQITNKLVNHLLWYIFPDKYKEHYVNNTTFNPNIDLEKYKNSDIDAIIYLSYQESLKATAIPEIRDKKKNSKSSTNDTENDIGYSDNELNKNNIGSGVLSDDEGKDWKNGENSDEDIIYDHPLSTEGNSTSLKDSVKIKKFGSANALSTLANTTGNGNDTENKIEYNVNQMQDRALQNRTFVYIKIPGAHHCISYKGPKDKNISDIFQFTFKFPTLEYRNKTWSWYEFLMAVKKDLTKTVLNHVASLMKEKIFKRKLNEKESNKMFGMLDEQIMYKFKKYYKNKSSNNNNTSNTSILTASTMTTINGNSMLLDNPYDDIKYIPEVNEEDLDIEYVEELQKELFNEQGQDIDMNLNNKTDNLSKDKSKQSSNEKASLLNKKTKNLSTLTRDKSTDSLEGNFPVPMREMNNRNVNSINNNNIITNSIQSINSFSAISTDYNEYMFIKKRMLFGKYMDDK
ncbi:hypothetical protein BCR32DRAFT_263844 [Anaeromyces robustus]|uniref:FMP27 GFWDK domain-containing protein n=1 Tax=Anaeromyces robustus TaxID=1754192 RepID=A0A1Y1XQG8_9FUNG|nr:hypothetical protein BCR32DRAFT_263844 [Anaeromyces robustus]|eukprot:ORX87977.1 hypothetical protein BCR32DRAFT_263844 [Anaeromyces robustus]